MKAAKLLDFNPGRLDLVMRDEDFVVYYDDAPLLTPGGNEVAHRDARLLRYLMMDLSLNQPPGNYLTDAYGIFSYLRDKKENGHDPFESKIEEVLQTDFLINSKLKNKTPGTAPLPQILNYLEENPVMMNLIFWGISMSAEGLREFLNGREEPDSDPQDQHSKEYERQIARVYQQMNAVQQAAACIFSENHHNGLLLPLLLVLGHITAREYAAVTLLAHSNSGYQQRKDVQENQPAIRWDKPDESLRHIQTETATVLEFTSYFGESRNSISVIRELIARGENDSLEFKSTFRWDLRQNKKNPAIEHAALKTMAAFINSEGGDLLIGVEDDGNIVGIETDGFPNDDKFLLHVWSLIKSSMGQEVSPYLKTTLEKFDGKTVCRVHCTKSPIPVFLRQKGFDEAFYIRSGPGTSSLDISEALKYIGKRF